MRTIRYTVLTALVLALLAPMAAAKSRLLVVSKGEAALQAYDTETYEPLFSVKLPGDPHEVVASPDGRMAYVADFEGLDNTISIIDLERGERVGFVNPKPSYKPHGLAINRDGSRLYVTCEASKAVVEVDPAAREVKRVLKLRDDNVHLAVLSPDEKWLYATSQANGTVSFIDLTKGELVRTVLSGPACEGLAITPDGKELWAVNRRVQTLSVINVATHKREITISAIGNPIRIHFTKDASLALVSCALRNEIAVFDRVKRQEIERIAVGEFPVGIELSPDEKRWFVTNGRGGSVSVIDAETRKQVKTFPVGEDPEGIFWAR